MGTIMLSHFRHWLITGRLAPRRRRRARERFILPQEWARLRPVIEAQPAKIRVFFLFLLLQAPRPSEARLAEWVHLDLTSHLWYKPKTKNGRAQMQPLTEETCRLLERLPRAGRYVFGGEDPDRAWSRTAVTYHWRKIRRQAGLADVQLRDLRRTGASWMTMAGENLKIVQVLLDHAHLNTTEIYARLDTSSLREALARHAHRVLSCGALLFLNAL